jgi:hypothetical protein
MDIGNWRIGTLSCFLCAHICSLFPFVVASSLRFVPLALARYSPLVLTDLYGPFLPFTFALAYLVLIGTLIPVGGSLPWRQNCIS